MLLITRQCLAFAGCLVTVVLAHATTLPDPSNPDVPVPAMPYLSAFEKYQPAVPVQMRPDKVWLAQDKPVAGSPGHGAMNMDMDMKNEMQMPGKQPMQPMDMHHGHTMEH